MGKFTSPLNSGSSDNPRGIMGRNYSSFSSFFFKVKQSTDTQQCMPAMNYV